MRQFSAQLGPLRFAFEWRLTLFTLLLLPLLVLLGFWQLDRADEKQALAQRFATRMALPVQPVAQLMQQHQRSLWADRQVSVTGTFAQDRYLLLDNRLRDGRFGYEVIALIDTETMLVPVNLGWLAGDPARRSQPVPELPMGSVSIFGRVYLPLEEAYVLGAELPVKTLPGLVQSFDAQQMQQQLSDLLQRPVAPLEVRVGAEHPAALRADWPVVNVQPEKHTGYAVQWFTMAAVLFIAFVWRCSNIGALLAGARTKHQ